jgi:hypothetical protein
MDIARRHVKESRERIQELQAQLEEVNRQGGKEAKRRKALVEEVEDRHQKQMAEVMKEVRDIYARCSKVEAERDRAREELTNVK